MKCIIMRLVGRRTAVLMVAGLLAAAVAAAGDLAAGAQMSSAQEQNVGSPARSNAAHKELLLDKDPQGNHYAAGELLVSYKEGTSEQAKEEALNKVGGKVEKDFPEIEAEHISIPEVKNAQSHEVRQEALEQKKEDLEQDPDVKAVDYNYVREGSWIPNDTFFSSQWALPKINAPQAWDDTWGSSFVRIAMLDSGIDNLHPDLQKVQGQIDYVNGDNDASDDQGHGTLTAGIAGANTNNRQGVAGTCPNCSLLIAKVLDNSNKAIDSNVIKALDWATSQNANVINMSLGLGGYSSTLEDAINHAWERGIVVVAAAGNDGSDTKTEYPAAYDNVIAVAATDEYDHRAIYPWASGSACWPEFTGRSPSGRLQFRCKRVAASNAGDWVDVAAPGRGIYTTKFGTTFDATCPCWVGNYAANAWGTSMAAPHVSGLAGLLFNKTVYVSNAQVRNQIESTAADLGTTGKDDEYGNGRINAQAAANFTTRAYQGSDGDPDITYSGDWSSSEVSGAFDDAVMSSNTIGDRVKLSFTGNSVTWWARKMAYGSFGRATVYIDGSRAGTVDLWHDGFDDLTRQPVFSKTWGATSGEHTIEIEVTNAPVDVDAISVTQPK